MRATPPRDLHSPLHQPHVAVAASNRALVGPTSDDPPRSDAVAAVHLERETMPWQTAPGVVIIVAAFSVSGMAIPLIHKLIKGEKRVIGRDDFDFLMAKRDKRLAAEKEGAK